MNNDQNDDDQPGMGQSWGSPAEGAGDIGAREPLGRSGTHHWRQSTITNPALDDRGGVFFAAVEMTRMPMILTDPRQPDNPIVFANNAFLDLTGYETDEILGRNCRFLQGPGTDREAVRELREAIGRREAIALEILNYRRDGSPFWNAVFIGPVYDPSGDLLYFFASQLDVSRRRESEQAYRQAQKMEAIGQLTAGIAHDFNNLLHIITASLERLSSRPEDSASRERYLRSAMNATERGSKLTQQLLTFARRSRLEPRSVELSGLIGSISELLDSAVGSKVELNLHLRRRLPEIQVDPVHLEMALINILVNARDASPGGGEITIRTEQLHLNGDSEARQLPPGDYVALSVIDQGEGMPPEVLARATEPFFTTKRAGEGTGLGLAMAHGFAQQSGGRLEIETEQGSGTTVRMLFPLTTGERQTPADPPMSQSQATRLRSDAQAVILIVEDDADIADLARETLSEAGYRTLVCRSGEEALQVFDERRDGAAPVELLFSDVIMPGGMNGLALATAIAERDPNLPILMTTGYNDEMVLQGPRPQAMDVLGKPYRRSELLDRVQSALRNGSRRAADRRKSDFGVVEE